MEFSISSQCCYGCSPLAELEFWFGASYLLAVSWLAGRAAPRLLLLAAVVCCAAMVALAYTPPDPSMPHRTLLELTGRYAPGTLLPAIAVRGRVTAGYGARLAWASLGMGEALLLGSRLGF